MPFGDTPGLAVGRGRPDFMMPQGSLITSALSNKGNPTGILQDNTFRVLDQQAVRLVDGKGNVLFSGVGPEAAKQAVAIGQDLSNTQGNKANWDIQTGNNYLNTDGTSGTRWDVVANEKKNNSPIGTILDIGLPILMNALIPGSGLLSTMAGSALGTAASGTIQGKSLGDIAKSAGLSAATAGLLKGTPIGGFLDKAVGSIPVVGDALQAVSKIGAGALPAAAADEIVVTALNPLASSLAGSALSSSLANSIASSYPAYTPPTVQSPLLQQTPPEPSGLDALSDITITGNRLPNVSPFAVNPVVQNLINDYAVQPAAQPVEQQPMEQRTDNTEAVDDLTVTGTQTPKLPFVAPTTNLFNNTQYNGGENVRDTQTTEQRTDNTNTADDLTITGTKNLLPPSLLTPAVTAAANTANTVTGKETPYTDDRQSMTDEETAAVNAGAGGGGIFDGLTTEQKLKLLALGISTIGGLAGGGGGTSGGGGVVPAGLGRLTSPVFDQKLSVLTPEQNRAKYGARNMTGTDWATWGSRPATSFFNNVQQQPTGMAHGGSFAAKRGGRSSFAVNGPGTGRSDDIPAVLSDGEYVIDAETVALLGDGSSKAGAKKLDDLRVKVRKHKGKKLAQGRFSANAKDPEAYLSGGRT